MATEFQPDTFGAKRTRKVVQELKTAFQRKGEEEGRSQKFASVTADAVGELDDAEKGTVKTLLFFSPQELDGVVDEMLASELSDEDLDAAIDAKGDKSKKKKKDNKAKKAAEKAAKKLGRKVKDSADIAIFGRMVADDHSLTVEGASLFSHALSTHPVSNELDYFSAVDDFNKIGESGAAHIGNTEFNSACYYRYVGLNVDMLKDPEHLEHFEDAERQKVMEAFCKAAILAVPAARKNSQFAQNPPFYILGLRRNSQPLSLVNAFENPVQSRTGYKDISQETLRAHWAQLKELYCLDGDLRVEAELPPTNVDDLVVKLVKGA
jgi:CRISPR system Cascade subunit CasC